MNDPHDDSSRTAGNPETCKDCDFEHLPVLVPEGKMPIDLTMRELDIASRKLGTDVGHAADIHRDEETGRVYGDPKRYTALGLLAWLWARRTQGNVSPDVYLDMEVDAINHSLGYHRPKPEPADDGDDAGNGGPTSEGSESD